MRMNGDVGCKPAQVWAAGLMDVAPDRIELLKTLADFRNAFTHSQASLWAFLLFATPEYRKDFLEICHVQDGSL